MQTLTFKILSVLVLIAHGRRELEHVAVTAHPAAAAVAERVIGTLRRECLGHLIVLSERHLQQVLREYVGHYNRARPHRSLALRAPLARGQPSGRGGAVVRRDRLGGLIHEYARAAA